MWLSLLRSFAPVRLSQRAFLLALFERGITDAGLIERWTGIPKANIYAKLHGWRKEAKGQSEELKAEGVKRSDEKSY